MDKETSSADSKVASGSPTKKELDVATRALIHFAQGKRHLLVNDVQSAVNSLQEACKLLAEQHGETAAECGDAYYYYGRALLEMARVENGVLGNALEGVPEGEDADCSQVEDPEKLTVDEKDTIGKQVGEALEENFIEGNSKVSPNGVEVAEKSEKVNVAANEIEITEVKEPSTEQTTIETCTTKDIEITDKSKAQVNVADTKSETVDEKCSDASPASGASKDQPKDVLNDSNIEMECEDVTVGEKDEKKAASENVKEAEESSNKNESEDNVKVDSKTEELEECADSKKVESEEAKLEKKENEKSDDGEDNSTEEDEAEDGEEVEEGGDEESQEPEGDQTSDEEEVGNLQLAWEVLELSKVIYKKQLETSQKKMSLKIADVHLRLGEVALESENYPQSVEELSQCLEIQLKELESTDRCLAETYYQIGVAHSFSDDFEKALENFTSANKVIEDRIATLTLIKDDPKKSDEPRDDPFYTEEGEIEELKKLMGEISEKILDMQEMKKDSDKKMQKAKAIAGQAFASMLGGSSPSSSSNPFGAVLGGGSSSSSNAFGAPSTPSTSNGSSSEVKETLNISHLIRKKRKPEDEAEKEEPKKVKGEDGKPVTAEKSSALETKETKSTNKEVSVDPKSDEKKSTESNSSQKTTSESNSDEKIAAASNSEEKNIVESPSEKSATKSVHVNGTNGTNGAVNGNGCTSPELNDVEMKDEAEKTPTAEELKKKEVSIIPPSETKA